MNVTDRISKVKGIDHIMATLRDGDPVKVPVPAQRKKWDALQATLDALPWVRLDLRAKNGDVLSSISGEDDFAEDFGGGGLAALAPFAKMLTDTVRTTQTTHQAEMRELVAGYQLLAGEAMKLLSKVSDLADDQYRMLRALSAKTEGETTEDAAQFSQVMDLIKAGMMWQASKGAAPPKPNGAPKPTNGAAKP